MNKLWFKIVYCFKAVCRFLFALIRNGNECEICGKKVYKTILCKTCIETKFIGKVSSCELRNTDSIKANQLENPFIHKIEKLELKHINKVYVLYPYDLWNKDLLYKWKIDGERSLSPLFAKLIAGVLLKNNIKIIDNVYLDKANEFIWPNESDEKNNGIGYCLGTRTHIGILSDGTVVPCCLDSDGIINLGNIYNNSLDSILNTKRVNNMIDGFRCNKKIEELCKHCSFLKE